MSVIRNILFPGVSAPNPAFAFALHSTLGDKKYCKHKYFSKHPQSQHPEVHSGTLNQTSHEGLGSSYQDILEGQLDILEGHRTF